MGLAFLSGMVATVNPCAFVLLPTYLMFFLGTQGQAPGSQRASMHRALTVSAALSAGFLSVFLVAGLIAYHFTHWITANAKYATLVIGLAFVVIGIAMLCGMKLSVAMPRVELGGRTRGLRSMFLFGVSYAVASIGCTLPLFSVTLLSVRREGVVTGVASVAAYGLGMALVVTALTLALATANTSLLRVLRRGMANVNQIAGAFVTLAGLYLVYYFWVVDVNESHDPVIDAVDRFRMWVSTSLMGNWQAVALVLVAVVSAAVVYVYVYRGSDDDEPGTGTDAGSGAGTDAGSGAGADPGAPSVTGTPSTSLRR